jgi:gamma-glutamyl:cysteine ligase YbdK (ATP-grasp superfamily)
MAGFVGVEREQFLMSPDSSVYMPQAKRFLSAIRNHSWTYELSACQVESRTSPQTDLSATKIELLANENMGNKIAGKLGLRILNQEVAKTDMPLDVYPNPRYLEIVKQIPEDRLRAACRVAGIHIHFGTRDINHAIAINNLLAGYLDVFCRMGDHSNGERLRLYRLMAENWQPVIYESPEHLFEVSKKEEFRDNPRNCWKLIRISIHGTVELRMFGSTDNVDEILEWVSRVKSITKEAR